MNRVKQTSGRRRKSSFMERYLDQSNFGSTFRKSNYLSLEKKNPLIKDLENKQINGLNSKKTAAQKLRNFHYKKNKNKKLGLSDFIELNVNSKNTFTQNKFLSISEAKTLHKNVRNREEKSFIIKKKRKTVKLVNLGKKNQIESKNENNYFSINFSSKDIEEIIDVIRETKKTSRKLKAKFLNVLTRKEISDFLKKYFSEISNINKFYNMKNEVGRGSYAIVYKGLDLKRNEKIVLKVIPIKNIKKLTHLQRLLVFFLNILIFFLIFSV